MFVTRHAMYTAYQDTMQYSLFWAWGLTLKIPKSFHILDITYHTHKTFAAALSDFAQNSQQLQVLLEEHKNIQILFEWM